MNSIEVRPVRALGPSLSLTVSKQIKPSVSPSNRQRFLRRVHAFWIDGVLEHSLHGASLIMLGLQEQLDALANPWHLVLQHPDTTPRSFPLGTRITEVYDAASGELLILGAPGSGKTTLLLELASDLLDRAEHDEQYPMPVIFPLSSWTGKQPLTKWMVAELISKYQVPRKLARTWVEANLILPLLDGLDEVPAQSRTACIETINTYHQEHAFLPLVVTSRSADYLKQTARVRLTSAVTIQLLMQQQINEYLASGGEPLWALRIALHRDAALRELAETPLMLSILTLTYHGLPIEELLRGGITPTRQQIFEHYVDRMLVRRGGTILYRPEQIVNWLTWLAQRMKQHNQTVFYIEQMQLDWLTKGGFLQCLGYTTVKLVVGLVFGLIVGPMYGLIGGLIYWLGPVLAFRLSPALSGLIINYVPVGVAALLTGSIRLGLISGFITGLIALRNTEIRPAAKITWSWQNVQRRWGIGLVVSLITTGLLVLYTTLFSVIVMHFRIWRALSGVLFSSISWGLGSGLITDFAIGLSSNMLEKNHSVRPNQGVWNSARNSGLVGLFIALTFTLINGLFTLLRYQARYFGAGFPFDLGLTLVAISQQSLLTVIIIGLIFWPIYGGVACINHVALRLLAWRAGSIPWNYPRFLDYATERVLLSKVGGGYIFIHRLLLEYFASLDTGSQT